MAKVMTGSHPDLGAEHLFLCRKGPYEFWLFSGPVDGELGYQGRILMQGDLIDSGEVFTTPHEAIDNIMAMQALPGICPN